MKPTLSPRYPRAAHWLYPPVLFGLVVGFSPFPLFSQAVPAPAPAAEKTQKPEQPRPAERKGPPGPVGEESTLFRRHVEALGGRLKTAGKERSVFTGEFTDENGNKSNAQIAHQFPNLVAAQGVRADGTVLKFEGKRVTLPLSKAEENFVESFTADTVEALLLAERSGLAVRCLGFNFAPEGETPGNPQPHHDLYSVTFDSKTRPDERKKTKLFWFDTKTHLLAKTTYRDGNVKVETRFLNWGATDGSKYPGRIERLEDGRTVFAFAVSALTAGPKVDEAAFR